MWDEEGAGVELIRLVILVGAPLAVADVKGFAVRELHLLVSSVRWAVFLT